MRVNNIKYFIYLFNFIDTYERLHN
jgi:hypothetical protein